MRERFTEIGISGSPCLSREAIWDTAWRITHRSSFQICCASSKGAMNCAGGSRPRAGSSQRARASKLHSYPVRLRMIGW